MLDYVLGIETYREEVAGNVSCNVLLVENPLPDFVPAKENLVLIWSGSRPGDTRERFNLYRLSTNSGKFAKHHHEKRRTGGALG